MKNPFKKQHKETIAGDGTVQQDHASTLGRYGIWAAIIAFACFTIVALGLSVLNLTSNPAGAVTQQINEQEKETVQADQAAAYSQAYLMAYLRSSKDNYSELATYIGEDTARRASIYAASATEIRNPVIASVEKTNFDFYSTKIQVDIRTTQTQNVNGEETPVETWTTQWYKVVVSSDGTGTFTPAGYPSATNPPETETKSSDYPYAVSNIDVTSAVADFGKAYMAATGDVNRYISPGATITAITPAPYKEAKLVKVTALTNLDGPVPADGAKAYIQAEFEVTDNNGNTRSQTYPLEITSRGERWEVSTIERSPHTF